MPHGEAYNHETVALDGEAFSDCEFRDCRLVYAGGEPPTFSGCKFDSCDWRLDDAAARTVAYLKTVWLAGDKATVQAVIKGITGAK
jgi:hypothetical protein